ncbi:MAG: ABC-type transport auxiliary lipoprotein family protein [Pseudomonadota bacterium]
MNRSHSRLVLLLLTSTLSGCSLIPARPPLLARHDFGPPPQHAQTVDFSTQERLLLNGFSAPEWLKTTSIQYRLLYDDPTRLRAYAYHQWLAPPSKLMEQRWQEQGATQGHNTTTNTGLLGYRLKVELNRFEQVFDSPDAARVVIQARAMVMKPDQAKPVMERLLTAQRESAPDVQGAIESLASLADTLITDIRQWAKLRSLSDLGRSTAEKPDLDRFVDPFR